MNNKLVTIKQMVLVVGAAITSKLGGWDLLLQVLVGFVVCDYFLGVMAASINKQLNSKVGFIGIYKKILLFIPIGIAFALDQVLGTEILRNLAIWFYLGNEGLSIVENISKAGVPIPKPVKDALVQLKDKGNEGEVV